MQRFSSIVLCLGIAALTVAAISLLHRGGDDPLPLEVRQLATLDNVRTARISSWDRTGGNQDCIFLDSGETRKLAEIGAIGSIRHIFFGTTTPGGAQLRELVLRMFWDGETTPSVETPLGDFFLTPYEGFARQIHSALITVDPGHMGSRGYHSWIPMPFQKGARVTLENQGAARSNRVCYQIDYEAYRSALPPDTGRFHAQWRRQFTQAAGVPEADRNKTQWAGKNMDGRNNYAILEATGRGRLLGLMLTIDNDHSVWYGEGDDMIFIDGEKWPPSYHGTGTEEIFGGGCCPTQEFSGWFSGYPVIENRGGTRYTGKVAMFRWYLADPVRFARSVRWSIEHGHANNFENEYTSVAYWYQSEPHATFPALPPASERLPRMTAEYRKARELLLANQQRAQALQGLTAETREKLRSLRREAGRLFQLGQYDEVLRILEQHDRLAKGGRR